LHFACQLAEHLHKSIDEILDLTTAELTTWVAYFEMKDKKDG
jgi:hypothetical protein